MSYLANPLFPKDMFIEITNNVSQLDMLSLRRVCTRFNAMIMSQSEDNMALDDILVCIVHKIRLVSLGRTLNLQFENGGMLGISPPPSKYYNTLGSYLCDYSLRHNFYSFALTYIFREGELSSLEARNTLMHLISYEYFSNIYTSIPKSGIKTKIYNAIRIVTTKCNSEDIISPLRSAWSKIKVLFLVIMTVIKHTTDKHYINSLFLGVCKHGHTEIVEPLLKYLDPVIRPQILKLGIRSARESKKYDTVGKLKHILENYDSYIRN